jgi:FkbM family methyltransferase
VTASLDARYRVKRLVLAPRVARRRRVDGRDPTSRALFEPFLYSRAMYRFVADTVRNRDLLTDVAVPPEGVVVDVGAYDGHWSQRMLERYDCRVQAFEPDPSAFAALRRNLGADPRATLWPYALGGHDGVASLTRDGPGSSLYGGAATFGTTDVEVRDVVTAFDELDLDAIDVLKLNIEGGEYDVLDRLVASRRLAGIGTLSVQFHEWHPHAHARRRRIRRALARTHRELWCYPWVWELWQRRA